MLRASCLVLAAAAAVVPPAASNALTPLDAGAELPAAPWRRAGLPEQKLPWTSFERVDIDGRRALRIEARGAYGNLVHPLRIEGGAPRLSWHWRLEQPIAGADLRTKAGDDNALKVCVFFDQPEQDMPWGERALLSLARARTGEALPNATLCYVWAGAVPVGTALDNAYTRRVRYLVLQNGSSGLRQWHRERRDIAADFQRLFGAESARMPPLTGIAVGADADNTNGHGIGHIADLNLEP